MKELEILAKNVKRYRLIKRLKQKELATKKMLRFGTIPQPSPKKNN